MSRLDRFNKIISDKYISPTGGQLIVMTCPNQDMWQIGSMHAFPMPVYHSMWKLQARDYWGCSRHLMESLMTTIWIIEIKRDAYYISQRLRGQVDAIVCFTCFIWFALPFSHTAPMPLYPHLSTHCIVNLSPAECVDAFE